MKDRIAEAGRVVGFSDSLALVWLEGGESCRKCGLAAMGLCKPGGTGMVLRAENSLGAGVGDRVRLAMRDRAQAWGYVLAYIAPLLAFLAGGILGYAIGPGWLDITLAFVFLGVTASLSYRRIRAMDQTERMHISRVIPDVPDFVPDGLEGTTEGEEYLRAFRR